MTTTPPMPPQEPQSATGGMRPLGQLVAGLFTPAAWTALCLLLALRAPGSSGTLVVAVGEGVLVAVGLGLIVRRRALWFAIPLVAVSGCAFLLLATCAGLLRH